MKRMLLLSLSSGILIAGSLPGFGVEWLVWIAFIPLLAAGEYLSPGKSFSAGLIAGAVVAGVLLSFIPAAGRPIGMSPLLSWPAYLLLIGYYGLYPALFALFSNRFFHRWRSPNSSPAILLTLFILPAAWAGLEFIHARLLPGLPWTFIFTGYFLWRNTILIQMADITGVYGLSFLVLLLNAGIYLCLTRRKFLPAAVAGAVLVLILVYGGYRLRPLPPGVDNDGLRVAVLQGNIPSGVKWDDEQGELIAARYLSLCRRADSSQPDLVVWSETAIPWPIAPGDDLVEEALKATAGSRAAHIVGYPAPAGGGLYLNRALLVLPDGEATARYDKERLLYFVEKGSAAGGGSLPGPAAASYVAGAGNEPLATPRGRAGLSICNENFYPEMARRTVREGAEFLVNLTNDAWWPDRFRLTAHFLVNVLRSVENRRATVVASNVGISALIDDRGRVIKAAPIREPFVLAGRIEKSGRLTFYTRRGDVFAVVSLLLAGGGIILIVRRG